MRLFDQDLGTHLKLICLFIDSLYATTSCSPGLPLQCFFKIKEPLYHSRNIFYRFFMLQMYKKTLLSYNLQRFQYFFIVSRFILHLSKRPPPLPEGPDGKSIQMNNSHQALISRNFPLIQDIFGTSSEKMARWKCSNSFTEGIRGVSQNMQINQLENHAKSTVDATHTSKSLGKRVGAFPPRHFFRTSPKYTLNSRKIAGNQALMGIFHQS